MPACQNPSALGKWPEQHPLLPTSKGYPDTRPHFSLA